jgi:chromosome partitioning protein
VAGGSTDEASGCERSVVLLAARPRDTPREDAIPRRIAFINEKGGSAKTTLVANLGAWLALERGHRVLALDLDPQGQLARALGVAPAAGRRSALELLLDEVLGDDASLDEGAGAKGGLPRQPTRIPGLDVVPADKRLGIAPLLDPEAATPGADPTARLARALDAAPELADYDFVLIDAPPSFGPLTLSALRAAREIVVPVPLTYLALDGCAELMRTVETVRRGYGNPALALSMVVPTFYRRTRLAHEILDRLKTRFPKEIAQTVLGYHVRIDEAQARGLSVFEHAPRDRGARALAALAEELAARRPERPTQEPA